MKLGAFSRVFDCDFDQALKSMTQLGLTHFHLNMSSVGISSLPEQIDPFLIERVQRSIIDSDLQIAGISATFNMIHPNVEVVEAGLRSLSVLAYVAGRVGCPLLTLCTGSRDAKDKWRHHSENESAKSWTDLCRVVEKAIVIAENAGLFLGIEPEHGNVVSTALKARMLLDEMGTDRLRIIFDPANLVVGAMPEDCNQMISQSFNIIAEDISVIHAKDRNSDGSICRPGEGMVDFEVIASLTNDLIIEPIIIIHDVESTELPATIRYLNACWKVN